MKRYLVLGLNDSYIDVTSLGKSKNKFYIEDNKNYNIGLDILLDNEINHTKELINNIKNDFNTKTKYEGIYFNVQNNQVIIRNIKEVKTKKESHIINLIKFEINAYIPLNLEKYSIKYKRIVNDMGQDLIQGILLPKNIIDVSLNIADDLKIKNKHLNVDFDILEKLMKINLIEKFEKNEINYVIENRKTDIIINTCYKNQVIQSYIRSKDDRTNNYLKQLCSNKNSYYFGLKDDFIDELNAEMLTIKNKINISDENNNEEIATKYICALGMIV